MKLEYAYKDLVKLLSDTTSDNDSVITSVAFDSRRITDGKEVLFIALKGHFRDGHSFIQEAYQKGVRHFLVSHAGSTRGLVNANEIVVSDTMQALWKLAKHHRDQFNGPVIAITGSNGKTIVKEWLSQLLSAKYNVAKSPKSYNSKLGVPISLLEITNKTQVAVFEVGVPEKGEMRMIRELVRPTHGILTSFGSAHRSFFDSTQEHLHEKLELFADLETFYAPISLEIPTTNCTLVSPEQYKDLINSVFSSNVDRQNAAISMHLAKIVGVQEEQIKEAVKHLRPLALRLETFEGNNGNLILSDTYSLDEDSLRLSLEYQMIHANGNDRIVIIGLTDNEKNREASIKEIVNSFHPKALYFHYPNTGIQNYSFENSSILIKGTRGSRMEQLARSFKKQVHKTYLEINLKAIRNNINYHKSILNSNTKLLCMIKAASYGSDAKRMGSFLENMGVDYLGVAYADEGVELRSSGIELPILIMNCEESSFHQCLEYNLEPAVYSLDQLDSFISFLIRNGIEHYPVHIKLETGMNRLGFNAHQIDILINLIKGQPEIYIKSIYSHLAEADIEGSDYTMDQIEKFKLMTDKIQNEFNYNFDRHILNSSGILNFPDAQFEMVRLGIGMYGVSEQAGLQPAIGWYSSVSQIKEISAGEFVGYGRAFIADKPTRIAIIPVGYADGFRRSLGEGKGGVYIHENYCQTVGRVCMDMIMVEVTDINVTEGDQVEIIGAHQTFTQFSQNMETIPYEVMTNFSSRVPRLFIDV